MVRSSKPRAGSLAFRPRKRVRRIYPRIKTWPGSEKIKILGFAGYKAGMSHAIILDMRKSSPTKGEEISTPLTILDCPPFKIIGVRAYNETYDGYQVLAQVWDEKTLQDKDLRRKMKIGKHNYSHQLKKIEKSLDKIKSVRLIVKTEPKKSGLGKKKPEVFEIEVGGNDTSEKWNYCRAILGKEIRVKDVFREGEFVDVIAVTKGKGTQGVVKRFGVKIQNRKANKKFRHIGTLGPQTPRRILWTVPRAGQLGFFTRTELNKRVLKIGEDGNNITPKSGFINYGIVKGDYLLVEGSVPGPRKRLIMLRTAVRPPKNPLLPTEIKFMQK